jgi:putative peptide zinc metalloprotease protein
VKKARAAAYLAAFIVFVAAILMIPTPLQIRGALVLAPEAPDPVYPEVPGQIMKYYVRDGDMVKAGQPIADLSNKDKQRERDGLQTEISVYRAKHDMLATRLDPVSRNEAKVYGSFADDLEPPLEKITEQIGKLTLRAPRDGMVIGLPHPETIGTYLKPGEGKPVCEIADPKRLKAVMLLDQGDVDLVKDAKQPKAWVKVYGTGERLIISRVEQVARRNLEDLPPELSNQAGGEIAAKPNQHTGEIEPLSAVYEVSILVDNSDLSLQPGLRGAARIDAGHASFGWWLWRLLAKTFHFTL